MHAAVIMIVPLYNIGYGRSTLINEVTCISLEVGTEGRLGGQARATGVVGTSKDLTNNLNIVANNLTLQLRTIAVTTTAVARGNFMHKIRGVLVFGD